MSVELRDEILKRLFEGLSNEEQSSSVRDGFTFLFDRNPEMMKEVLSRDGRYFGNILRMTQSTDEQVAADGEALESFVESILQAGNGEAYDRVVRALIRDCLMDDNPNSVSYVYLMQACHHTYSAKPDRCRVANLVECVSKALWGFAREKKALVEEVLPNIRQWVSSLDPFLSASPNPSLAITDQMSSSLYLVSRQVGAQSFNKPHYDRSGHALPLRAGMFFVRLFTIPDFDEAFETFAGNDSAEDRRSSRATLVAALLLTLQLANDSLGVPGSMPLWGGSSPETEQAIINYTADCQRLLKRWLEQKPADTDAASRPTFLDDVQQQFKKAANGTAPSAFYNARALAQLRVESLELHGSKAIDSQAVHEALRALPKASGKVLRQLHNLSRLTVP